MARYEQRGDGVVSGNGVLTPVPGSRPILKAALLFLLAAASGLLDGRTASAQCTHSYVAVPLNVQQTYTFVTDATNTRTFAATACDPNARGVFDTAAHALLAEQAEEGPIASSQITGTIYGTFYVGGTTGAEYIQYTPTSNPGFAYANTVTYYTNSALLGAVLQTIVINVAAAPLPNITGLSASAGPTTGGASITITGTGFTGATAVSFGGTAAASFTVNSATSISATTPAHAAGQTDIAVTTPNGTSSAVHDDQYTFVTPPAITSLMPTSGTTGGGTTVTITGTNLSNATQILFNGSAGTALSSTATSATVTAPAHAAGQVDVTLTTAGGATPFTSADHYTFIAPPTAGASSATVSYNSSANPVTLNISGGPTSVAVASAPSHGTATASGTSITFTPTTGYFGSDSFTYTATNSAGTSSAATVSVTVSGPSITVTPATLTSGTFGSAYSQTLSVSGGQTPYVFSAALAGGALPSGLSLSSAGVVSGTPTAAGTFTFSVSGTDSSTTAHASFTSGNISLTIAPIAPGAPTIGTATAGNLAASVAFTAPAANGGAAVTSYTVTASPGGATAIGSASPITVAGLTNGTAYSFTVTATNSAGTSPASSPSNSVTPIGSPVAGASSAIVAYNSASNNIALNLSGGAPSSVAIGSAASHGTATASGTSITYTPVTGFFGSDSFTYTATNGFGTSSAATVSVTVSAPAITVTPTTLASGVTLTAYSQTLTASGGKAPYTFLTTVASGALPGGFTLTSTGTVSGTALVAGTYTFTVSGTDSSTVTHASFTSGTITLVINSAAPLPPGAPTIGTATAGNAQATVAFTPPASNGGATITSYTVTSNPSGITASGAASPITVTGLANGTTYTFTVTATNSAGTSLSSLPSNSVTPLAPPIAGTANATVAYGSAANTIALNLSGGAPASVAIATAASHGAASASGTTITYTPATGYYGSDSFTYTATNSSGTSPAATASITISPPVISVNPTTLTSDTVGSAYSQTLSGSGGQAPYTFATTVASGSLPGGLSLSSTGAITGTPTTAGTSTFTISGTDSSTPAHAGFTSATISLTINAVLAGAPTIGTATAGDAQATVTFTAPASNGGSSITSYTVTSLPGGITTSGSASPITVTGLTNGNSYTFTVTATNAAGTSSASASSNAVTPVAPSVAGSVSATVAYDSSADPIALNFTGGAPTSVAVALAASHGTATASGTSITYTPNTGYYGTDSFTYTGTNANGTSSPATVSITVSAPSIGVSPATLPSGAVGMAYSHALTASGGQSPYAFSTTVASGSLPAGLSLSSAGVISGTPAAVGTSTFTVSGTDSSTLTHAGFTSGTITLAVTALLPGSPTIGAATAGNTQVTVTFSPPASNGGTAITGYTATSSPGGFTATGAASPLTVTGLSNGIAYTFTVTATNSIGTGPASAASNSVTPIPPPVSGSASATVVYDSSANPITLNLSGGAPASVAVASAASHGSATASGATITYTPTTGFFGSDSFTYTATNGSGTSSPSTVSVSISAPTIAVTPTALTAGTEGTAYSQTLTAAGGQAPYTFVTTLATGSLPAGLSLSNTGAITGTPTTGGTFTFTVTGTDSSTATHASFTSATLSLTIAAVAPGAPTIGTATAGNAQASVTFAAPASNGGSAITSYTVTSSPGGLTGTGSTSPITVTGLTNGTAYTFTVTATNSAGTGPASAASNSVTPKAAQTITFANPGTQAYNSSPTVTATSNSGLAVTFSSTTTTVCTVTSGGALTFVTAGTCTIAADQSGTGSYLAAPTVAQSFTISAAVPGAPTIVTATAGNTQASVAFIAPASNGGSAITSYTVTSTPGGFTSTSTGSPIVVSGLTNGTAYTFTVTAMNSAGTSSASPASNSVTPSAAVTAGATSATIIYDASAQPITLNLSGGAPTSVAVVSAASHGTATASGTTVTYTPATGFFGSDSFTYNATNSSGTSGPATVSVTISAPTISVAPTTLSGGTVGSAYSQNLTASGGQTPYIFSNVVASGALPPGLTLASTGAITGTPTAAGNFTFTATGTDSSTATRASFTSSTLSLTVSALLPGAPTIGTATAGNAQASVGFTQPASNGGSAITSYTVTSSPGGFSATGSSSPITVTGLTNGTAYTFTVTASNSAGTGPASAASSSVTPQATQSITFANPGSQSFNSSPTLTAAATSALSVVFTSGTTAVCTVTAGGALTFVSPGTCTVNANQAGNAAYQAAPQVAQTFTVTTAAPGAPTIGTATAGNAQATVSFTPPASNGGAAITSYTVTASPGPAAANGSSSPITLNGLINGTAYTFTVTATNSSGAGPASAPSNAVTPSATVAATQAIASTALTQNHAATAFTPVVGGGGTAPLAYSVTPALPAGLSISAATGSITGTPTAASPATTYTVTVTDATSATATATFSLTVNSAVAATTGSSPSTVTQNTAVTPFTPVAGSGGTTPFTYTVSPSLPASLTINPSTGQITGTPTGTSPVTTYTVTVIDANGATATATFALAVAAPVNAGAKSITAAYNANGTTSTAIDLTSSINGGATSVAVATAPSHGTATSSGLVVTYTPTASFYGPDSFTYTASNSTSTSASATVSITISTPAISLTPTTLAGGAVGVAYSQTLAPVGGAAPYTFSTAITSGALPAGLTLSAAGVLSGTPSAACTCTFTVSGSDSSIGSGPANFTSTTLALTIVSGAPTVASVAPPLGLAVGGATVTITGSSFLNPSIVSFGNTPATSVTYVSASTLNAVAPAGTGTVDIVVTTPGGSSAVSSADRFTYLAHAGALNNPLGTAVDGNGNTFIADPTLGYIVEVPAGCQSLSCETIVGGVFTGLAGVTVDSSGNLYALSGGPNGIVTQLAFSASANSYVAQSTVAGGLNLPSTTPAGVAVDDMGNIFITETADHTVVEEPYNNSTATYGAPMVLTTGGTSSTPTGIAVDDKGDVYYADPGTGTINELVPGSSTPIVLATGVNAQSVALDASGNVYYSDSVANTITKIPFNGTSYGTAVVIATGLSAPYGLSVDDNGNLLVANNAMKSLVKVTVDTPPSLTFASTQVGATSAESPLRATLANIGTSALTFPPTSVPNPSLPSGFVLDSATTCPQIFASSAPQTLAEGASCTYAIDFSPAAANVGADTGALTLTDDNLNAANATQSVPMTGTAVADDGTSVTLTLKPASPIVFGKSVAITAVVHDLAVPATVPTGSITFTSTSSAGGASTVAAAVPLSEGSANVASFRPSSAGIYTLTGSYPGAVGSAAASSGTLSLVVNKATPVLAYALATGTQTYGTAIPAAALNATAVDANGATIPGSFAYTTTVGSTASTLTAGSTILPVAAYTITATFIPANTANYTSGGTVTASYTVTPATATVTLSGLSYSYTGTAHSATATVSPSGLTVGLTYNGGASSPVAGGSYTVLATVQDANYSGSSTGTLVIRPVSTGSVTLSSDHNPVLTQNPVNFTAIVSSSISVPTGMVNFIDTASNTSVGTASLSNGTAVLSTSTLPIGAHNIVAAYQGDADFLALNSAPLTETVLDFTLNLAVASGSISTVTASPGGIANYQFDLSPTGSTTFTDPISLSISGQPTGSTYTITPTIIPAGAGPTNVALDIVLPQNSALLRRDGKRFAPFALALLLLPLAGRMRGAGSRLARVWTLLVLLAAGIGITTGLTSCGSASGFFAGSSNGPRTYNIILTGTSGSLRHSTTVVLNVP